MVVWFEKLLARVLRRQKQFECGKKIMTAKTDEGQTELAFPSSSILRSRSFAMKFARNILLPPKKTETP